MSMWPRNKPLSQPPGYRVGQAAAPPVDQVAKEAGCGQATVSDLASGKAREPRGSLALSLLRVGRSHGVRAPEIIQPTARGEAQEAA